MTQPVRVGLVGAGPWAQLAHAPVLSGGPETELVGIWARRTEAAAELAAQHGSRAVGTYEELLDSCEAVAFAVPPEVQGRMATQAAKAGKHLLLDKPVAESAAAAQRLADTVSEAGVRTVVLLTYQFTEAIRRFLPQARALEPAAAAHENISGGFLAGPFSQSPWRHEGGVLPDVGPHVVDLFTSLLGPAVGGEVQTHQAMVRLSLRHESGAFSHAVLGAHHTGAGAHSLRVYAPGAVLDCDWEVPDEDRWGTVRREFAAAVRTGAPHACDVHRGAELQRVLERAMVGA